MASPQLPDKAPASKYTVWINGGSQGSVIGEHTHVEQHFHGVSSRRFLLVGVVISVIAVALIVPFATKLLYVSTSFPFLQTAKQVALQNLETLNTEEYSPGVSITRYESIFGNPTFTRQDVQKGIIEYIFVNTYFYLDVIAANDANTIATHTSTTANRVLYFAVTIRDLTFHPTFKSPGYPLNRPSFQVTLGTSTFETIQPISAFMGVGTQINTLAICVGANWFSYYEMYYLGRSGEYRQFGVGLNDQGLKDTHYDGSLKRYVPLLNQYNFAQSCPTSATQKPTYTEQQLRNLESMRKNVIINTYAESAPDIDIKEYMPFTNVLGISSDLVGR
jgi:hypothetical protein